MSALPAQLKYNSLGFRILTCHGEDLKDGISEGIGVSYPVFPLTTILYGQRMRRPYFREDGKTTHKSNSVTVEKRVVNKQTARTVASHYAKYTG